MPDQPTTDEFDGGIGDVFHWPRALSTEEAQQVEKVQKRVAALKAVVDDIDDAAITAFQRWYFLEISTNGPSDDQVEMFADRFAEEKKKALSALPKNQPAEGGAS